MKLHNRYRKAKRFKLDDDLEVVDEFSGHKKSHDKRGWDFYDYRRHTLWRQWAGKINRLVESRVGSKWDDVYSALCKVARHQKEHVGRWIVERAKGNVNFNVYIDADGDVCSYGKRWGLGPRDLYVNPETGILCRFPASKPKPYRPTPVWRKNWWEDRPRHYGLKFVMDGTTEYVREEQEIKERIGCGLFKTYVVFDWYKYVPYTYTWTSREGDAVQGYVDVVKSETRYRKYLASKKAIRRLKLNSEEK